MNDVMYQNQMLFRSLPLAAGGLGLVSLLANRILSGVSSSVVRQLGQGAPEAMQGRLLRCALRPPGRWLPIPTCLGGAGH